MKTVKLILVCSLVLSSLLMYSQRGRGHHHGRHAKVVVKRSHYRPHKVVVFRPAWRPAYTCHRRWVFFPIRNIYWDNWRNHYVFWNGTVWISQAAVPATLANVDMEKEKTVELKEDEDDVDDIYASNDKHKTEYKAE